MPRSNTGNYSLPNGSLVNEGDTISPSQHNPPFLDVAAALTDSLSRSGAGGMQAPLSMGGNRITNLGSGTSLTDAVTLGQVQDISAIPPGVIMDFAGSNAPLGWLLCGGQSVSRAEYPGLFSIIGTTYGSINSSSFNLPDIRGRVTAGRDFTVDGSTANRLTNATMTPSAGILGASGGGQTQSLAIANLPAHSHTGTTASGGEHTHTYGQNERVQVGPDNGIAYDAQNAGFLTTSASGAHAHTFTTDNTGGAQPHPNVQPTIILNKIIKT